MTDHSQQGFATRAIHPRPAKEQGALSPPLYLTSTTPQESLEAFDEIRLGERSGYAHGRTRNPRRPSWKSGWPLSGGRRGRRRHRVRHGRDLGHAVSLLQSGDEIVVDQIVYGTAFTLFTQGLGALACARVFADFTRPETVAAAIGPKTRAVYLRRRPIPTCGWSTSRRCRPSRAARDC